VPPGDSGVTYLPASVELRLKARSNRLSGLECGALGTTRQVGPATQQFSQLPEVRQPR